MSMASCSRGTCSSPAVAGITYDSGSLSAWVIDLHADTGHMMWLCQKHVQTLQVPQGWTVSDERDGVPRLWTVTPDNVSAPSRKRSRVRRQRTQSGRILEVEELQLFEIDEPAREAIAPVASLDAARNSARPHNGSGLIGEMSPTTLLG
ncbi:MAG: hypothetical protein CL460_09625 [Acidimicrobiaceae bacterium]|nr:hypothetical protein [Acidimicrobiaceae bacterium]MEC9058285.1 DUF3499 family protein [Actinomycetota bacterium]